MMGLLRVKTCFSCPFNTPPHTFFSRGGEHAACIMSLAAERKMYSVARGGQGSPGCLPAPVSEAACLQQIRWRNAQAQQTARLSGNSRALYMLRQRRAEAAQLKTHCGGLPVSLLEVSHAKEMVAARSQGQGCCWLYTTLFVS